RAENVEISAFSTDPAVNFVEKGLHVPKVDQGDFLILENRLEFSVGHFNDSSAVGTILFEIKGENIQADTVKAVFFVVPESPYLGDQDMLVLDGNTVKDVPVFLQGPNVIENQDLSGGKGNGNGILERGEEALV